MPLQPIAYVSSPLDRKHELRTQSETLAQLRQAPASRLVRVSGDNIATKNGALWLDHDGVPEDAVFLGTGTDGAWFAIPSLDSGDMTNIRTLMLDGNLDVETVSILAQARSLAGWHERHQFCANCGTATLPTDGGYRRHCAACEADHFPRTDPVVIMAIRHSGRILLGRQAAWPPGMYSALAGFVEPGETIEQAVRREVFEESAIRVGDVHYVASQPWPHPSSLMIGVVGEALSHDIRIDPKELETARWFDRDETELMLSGTHPEGLHASRPQAIAHLIVRKALSL